MNFDSLKPLLKRSPHSILPLDGLRALAIIMVICFHTHDIFSNEVKEYAWLGHLPPYVGGWVGVPLFFALSGYLIGKQIWTEFSLRKKINFRIFFIKRALRIWPLFYFLYFIFLAFPYKDDTSTYLANFFFLSNYLGDNGPILGSWSLSTEEQFYLLIPLFINTFSRFSGSPMDLKKFRTILLGLLFVPIFARTITWYFFLGLDTFDINLFNQYLYRPFHTHAEGLIAGLILSNLEVDRGLKPTARTPYVLVLGFALAILSLKFKITLKLLMISLAGVMAVWYCLIYQNNFTKFLSHPFLGIIAKLSFSMYLIHWPCLLLMQKYGFISWAGMDPNLQLIWDTILILSIATTLSVANFFIVEHPCLKLRDRLLKSRFFTKSDH